MTSLSLLRVSALVATVSLLGVACGDDEMGGTGLSGGSQSASGASSGGSSGASSSAETTDSPTTAGSVSNGESTSSASTTAAASTSGVPETTGPDSSSGDPTNQTTDPTDPAKCGNGAIDGNEQCDGQNLNGFTCEALGNAGGTLQCDPVTCTFDTQLCEGGGGTSG